MTEDDVVTPNTIVIPEPEHAAMNAGLAPHMPADLVEWLARQMAASSGYIEYGGGGSTILAANLVQGAVLCVESSSEWVERLLADQSVGRRSAAGSLVIHHADIGPTAEWGRPNDGASWEMGLAYAFQPLLFLSAEERRSVDLVLVDGRFRVACALSAMLLLSSAIRVVIDDYVDRPEYRVVEQVATLDETVGRAGVLSVRGAHLPRCLALLPVFLQDWR